MEQNPDNASSGDVYIGGYTKSTDLPSRTTSGFRQAGMNGIYDGFIASFDKTTGQLNYDTYFGGAGSDEILCMASDPANSTIYFGGTTGSTSTSSSCASPISTDFSICAGSGTRYFQSAIGSTTAVDGFVASINTSTKALTWSTYFGGANNEEVRSIAVSTANSTHKVYIGGRTNSLPTTGTSTNFTSPKTQPPASGDFPLTNPVISGHSPYFQSTYTATSIGNDGDGFLASFDNNFKLAWNTYFGGNKFDGIWKVGVNSAGDLYTTGYTQTYTSNNSSSANTSGQFPVRSSAGEYSQAFAGATGTIPNTDAFIARFSSSYDLLWSTYFGGSGASVTYNPFPTCDLAIAPGGDVFMSGFSYLDNTKSSASNIPVFAPAGRYNQSANASTGLTADNETADGWIAQFSPSNSKKWITNFGGQVINQTANNDPDALEQINAIAVGGTSPNINLYTTGTTRCDNTPNLDFDPASTNDYYQQSYSFNDDVFIGRFFDVQYVGVTQPLSQASRAASLQVRPNPSSGAFRVKYQCGASGDRNANIIVLNSIGQTLIKETTPINSGGATFIIDLSALPAGVYILNVNGAESARLIRK